MLGGGALAAAGVSFLVPDSPVVGGVTFAIAAVLLLFAAAARAAAPAGARAVPTTRRCTRGRWSGAARSSSRRVDGHGGQVRIGGELWSARALDDHDVIEEGTPVTVMQISGATALVVAAGLDRGGGRRVDPNTLFVHRRRCCWSCWS